MDKSSRYRLRITAYTPETIPLSRLACYMQELANLLGNGPHVHFGGLLKGSTILRADVETQFAPGAETRVQKATQDDGPADARKAYQAIEALLKADGARGTLSKEGGGQLLKFLGCDAPVVETIGPIREAGVLEGELVRVGGKDRTVHALLVAPDGREYKLTTTDRQLARDLAGQLFSQVRVTGTGTWYRDESGKWNLDTLSLQSFEAVEDRSLLEAVSELRAVKGSGWENMADPLAALKTLRGH